MTDPPPEPPLCRRCDKPLDKTCTYVTCHRCRKGKNRKRSRQSEARKRRTLPSRFARSRRAAKQRGKSWSLTFEQYEVLAVLPCHYCTGLLGKVEAGSGLDRIDNDKGYEPGNVLPCCTFCNLFRADRLTVDETRVLVDCLLRLRGLR